ncbi:MAG: site-2 protease family protein [Proteobacteria bacterium]|nr:site-2 protease family protein [Pseudomonadota bacterium]
MQELSIVQKIAVWALPVLFAITLHEVAHGWVAKLLGDRTAEQQGRLSLNPLDHIDPIGTLLVPGLMLLTTGMIFGWAKPVPVDFGRLRNPRKDMVWVALAGPAANLLMAIFWALTIRLAILLHSEYISQPLGLMGQAGIMINVVLMVLNLLPLPPLDGGRIALGLLPPRLAYKYSKIEPWGMPILLVLMVTNLLWVFMGLPVSLFQALMNGIAGI